MVMMARLRRSSSSATWAILRSVGMALSLRLGRPVGAGEGIDPRFPGGPRGRQVRAGGGGGGGGGAPARGAAGRGLGQGGGGCGGVGGRGMRRGPGGPRRWRGGGRGPRRRCRRGG